MDEVVRREGPALADTGLPEMTPWHPKSGRKAIPLQVFYLFAYGSAGLFFLAWAGHGVHRF